MKHDSIPRLSLAEARAIAVRTQRLAEDAAPHGLGKEGVLQAVQHLGYVQVDTVNVVQRAHHHVLWSRVPDYAPAMLDELHGTDVALYEYWNHAASYLPMRDFRFSLPLMEKYKQQMHWSVDSPEIAGSITRVLELIRKSGPLMVSELESTGKVPGWGESKLGKIERRALHELWMRGDIMIRRRHGMQKVFDLTERVLPAGTDTRMPVAEEAAEFHVRTGLRALGIARMPELHYMRDGSQARAQREAVQRLVESGEAVEVHVAEEAAGENQKQTKTQVHTAYALRTALEPAMTSPVARDAVRLLSPFDNFTIQRKRLSWLFGFDYTIEIYVVPAKRKYGYFVLPILWGDRLVGRMDVKAHRAEKRLAVNNLVFEPDFTEFAEIRPILAEALTVFARFQGCEPWEIAQVTPKKFKLSMPAPRRRISAKKPAAGTAEAPSELKAEAASRRKQK